MSIPSFNHRAPILHAALLAAIAAGCGGAVVSVGDDAVPGGNDAGGGSGDAATTPGSGPRSTAGNAGATPSLPLAACNGDAGAAVAQTDASSAKESVLGIWLLCTSASPFGTTDEVGIEILATGGWYKMYNQSGVLVRGDADGELGTFTVGGVTPGGSSFTLDLLVSGSTAVDDVTTVSSGPGRMTIGAATYAFYQQF